METLLAALSEGQIEQIKSAPTLITILVAGADGTIDSQELNWAEKLTHIRSYADSNEGLNEFYASIEPTFGDSLDDMLKTLPESQSERETTITKKLADLNKVLSFLDNSTAYSLYKSFTSFAEHIAKASGGFLRFGSISSDEKKWISLPMIDSIILETPEDEAE